MDRRRRAPTALVLVLLAAVGASLLTACGDDEAAPASVAIFGDSLTMQAWPEVERLADAQGLDLSGQGVIGAAPCDMLGAVEERLGTDPPDRLVVAFVGNNLTACTGRVDGAALADRYATDLARIAELAADAGAEMVVVGPPAMGDDDFRARAPDLTARYEDFAAATDGVEFVDGTTHLSPEGFAATLPCDDAERGTPVCVDDAVAVRDPDGVHLAEPARAGEVTGGMTRWARTLVEAGLGTSIGGAAAMASASTEAPSFTTPAAPSVTYAMPPLPPIGRVVPPGALATVDPVAGAEGAVVATGDSLTLQAWGYLDAIVEHAGGTLTGGAYGGVALCDWLPTLPELLDDARPTLVVLAFAGNNLTPCTNDANGDRVWDEELVARYERDVEAAIELVRAHGAQVVLVAPPRMDEPQWDRHAVLLGEMYRVIAAREPDVGLADTAAVLTPEGFTVRSPCLGFETAALGCDDAGTIVVRDADGTHLAAPGDSGYSPGAWRYAAAALAARAPAG